MQITVIGMGLKKIISYKNVGIANQLLTSFSNKNNISFKPFKTINSGIKQNQTLFWFNTV